MAQPHSQRKSIPVFILTSREFRLLGALRRGFLVRMARSLLTVAIWVACAARTGTSPTTLNGARGGSVSLPSEIPAGPDVAEVTWRLLSPRKKIVTYSNKNIDYYGSEEYRQRITFHPGNFSLEIRNLRREDAGDYELTVTASSGAQTQRKMRLQVYDWMGIVRGTRGETVFLPAGITPLQGVSEVVWRSNGTRIAEYANGNLSYFGTEEYKRRLTLHPGNFSLEIRDLRREDAGEYETEITVGSGAESKARVQLEVDDSGDRSSHTAWILPVVIVVVVIIVILLCCGIVYMKRHVLRSLWDKHMGKKSGTSDEPAVTQSLNRRPDGEQSS